jgi:biotin transport system permease protein
MERNPRVLLTPMVIRVVAKAHATGDALTARGIGDT